MAPEIGRIGTWTPSSIWENAGDRDEAIAELEELGFGAVWLGSPRGDLELPRALRLAAARSAGAHPYLVTPDHTRTARAIVGPDALLAPEQKVVLETDPATARANARPTLELYFSLPNYTNNLRRLGFTDADYTEGGSDRLVDAIVAWGDPEQILARVAEHHAAGADHVSIQVLTGGQRTGKPLPREEWRAIGVALETMSSPS